MRILLAAALVVIAAPALAQDRAPPPEAELAQRLNDPATQISVAGAVAAMVGTLMDTRVGPLASLGGDVRPDDTLRDLNARRGGDPYPEGRVFRDTRTAAAGVGRAANGLAAMMPELRATAARLADQLDGLAAATER